MSPRRTRRRTAAVITHLSLTAVAVALAAALFAPASALAATHGGGSGHAGGGMLSVASIFSLSDDLAWIAKHIFGSFVKALLPASLTKDGIKLLTWLAALPQNPLGQTYKGVGTLESDMRDVGIAFIPLTLTLSAARYTVSGLTGGSHHPMQSVVRVIGSALTLVLWPWLFNNITALINVMTSTIFGFADVNHGLTVLWTTMFGGAAAFGDFSGFAELLIIAAIALVVALIILKVAILVLLAFLFVIGPLAIMLSPVPELSALTKLFGAVFTAAAIIPIGWALMFALGGAFIGSATQMPLSFTGVADGFLSLCAGLLCLFATLKWPTFIIGFAKTRVTAFAGQVGRAEGVASGAIRGGVHALPRRVAAARSSLDAGGRTFARSIGAVGGAMGMPRGGAVGAAARLPGRALSTRRQDGNAGAAAPATPASTQEAWQDLGQRAERTPAFTRPRPIAAAKRAADVAKATPVAVAASMGSRAAFKHAFPEVANRGAAAAKDGQLEPDVRRARMQDGAGGRIDPSVGTAHLHNARAAAQVRSPSARHELDAKNRPGTPPAGAGAPGAASANPSPPKRVLTRPAPDGGPSMAATPRPSATPAAAGPARPTPTPAPKPLAAAKATPAPSAPVLVTPKPAPAPKPAASPAAAPKQRPVPQPPAPVASPAPSRPDPRSEL